MKYYRIQEKYDNYNIIYHGKITVTVIGKELYTEKEMLKYHIPFKITDEIILSSHKIYWFFGCRWEL